MSSNLAAPLRRFAKLSTVSTSTDYTVKQLRRMIAAGHLTGYRLGNGTHLLVDLAELDELIRPIGASRAPAGGELP